VGRPAIDLDDKPLVAPEEIDLETVDANVHPGLGKAVAAAEAKEALLELAPGSVGAESVGPRQAKELGLT
jgi:hypothetical protein